MKAKLILVWHEAGNPAYWDRFRALSAFFEVTVLGLRRFQGVTFDNADSDEPFTLRLYKAYFEDHWLSYISPKMLIDARRMNADLVYVHEEPHAVTSFALALLKRKRIFFLDSAVINKKAYFFGWNPFERFVYRAVNGVFARNSDVIDVLQSRGCKTEKILGTLGNGVSGSTFFSTSQKMARSRLEKAFPQLRGIFDAEKLIIGFAGRIWRPKGISIFEQLIRTYPCKVIMCGPVIDWDLADTLSESGIVLLPKLSAGVLKDFYTALDVFVLPSIPTPSWREQFGRVLIESIYSGTPAMGSNIGAIPTIVGDDACFAPQDVTSLIECLERHGTTPLRADLLRRQTATVAEKFTWLAIAKRVKTAYEDTHSRIAKKIVIFQNYFAPYRAALFELLGEAWNLTICYIHRPEDEGRNWGSTEPVRFRAVSARYYYIGQLIFYRFFRRDFLAPDIACVILLDDNPSNLLMIFHALMLRLRSRARVLVWIEHIPDSYKPLTKLAYQKFCSRILLALSDGALAFSAMTEEYIKAINPTRPVFRVSQAVPHVPVPYAKNQLTSRKFGYLGSNSPRKNVDSLITAFLKLNLPDSELHIAGYSPAPSDPMSPSLFWHGYVSGSTREEYYRTIDVLILPSLAEPWGLVVNEALERNCICLVSNRCGSREIVEKGDPRLVFEPTLEGIQEAIRFCHSLEEQEIRLIARRLQNAFQPYTLETAKEQISSAIQSQ